MANSTQSLVLMLSKLQALTVRNSTIMAGKTL
jgi:hypothetical protein